MNSRKVLKPFATENRRFKVGDDVTEIDVKGYALSFEDLNDRGFIEGSNTVKRGKATKETST